WLRIGTNRRRDEVEIKEVPTENVEAENEEVNQGENQEINVEWETETENEEVVVPEDVEPEAPVHGEPTEKEVVNEDSRSGEMFFDAVGEERSADEDGVTLDVVVLAPTVPVTPAQTSVQLEGKQNATGVDPSGP
ncbi:hypothetical protein Dimus_033856, partial [Dionaea muscipula]